MKCFKPLYVPDPRYPGEGVYITVPCRHCTACVVNRQNDWARRLVIESQSHPNCFFLTLTYRDEPKTYVKEHIQLYVKKLRTYEKNIRFFFVGERGEKRGRVHYHAIIFSNGITPDVLLRSWDHGFGSVQPVNSARCYYVAKYCVPSSRHAEHFIYVSRKPALGYALTDRLAEYVEKTGKAYFHVKGRVTPIPRYNRRKLKERDIFTRPDESNERDRLALEKYFREHGNESYDQVPYFVQQQEQFTELFNRKKKK